MGVCEHCKSRFTWDCDDGSPYPKGGCDGFELDFQTLTKKQQKTIKKILMHEEIEKEYIPEFWLTET